MEKAVDLAGLIRVTDSKPLKDDDFNKFYVDTSEARGEDSAINLVKYFYANKNNPKKILFMGHGGSGKSTELERVRKKLEPDFFVTTFSVRDEIDIMDLKYTDLVFIILDKLLESLKTLKIEIDPNILDNLYNYWNDKKLIEKFRYDKMDAGVTAGAKLNFLTLMMLDVKGVLNTGKETKEIVRSHIEPKISQLMKGINDLIDIIYQRLKDQDRVPILIIEDLDKLEIPVAEDLFLNHKNILTELKLHIIYTFPIFLNYSYNFKSIRGAFNSHEFLSMIKIHNKEGGEHIKGIDKIKEIISMRADSKKLFEDKALELLIKQSGGVLRDLFEMIQGAALNSMSKDLDKINYQSAESAYFKLRSGYERTIYRKYVETLKRIHLSKSPLDSDLSSIEPDECLMELLNSLTVIEYNGERWCDLHPAVEDILKLKRII